MHRTFVLALPLMLAFSGCTDTTPEEDLTETPLPPAVSPPTAPPAPRPPVETLRSERVHGGALLIITNATENGTVTIHHNPQPNEGTGCLSLDAPATHARYHYVVWNKTGRVAYKEFQVPVGDLDRPFDVVLRLPEDPPYVLHASFCTFWPVWEFHAYEWDVYHIHSELNATSRESVSLDAPFPPGALATSVEFTMEYPFYLIEGAPITGSVTPEQGVQYGDWFFYMPGETGENWSIHGWHHPDESGWEMRHHMAYARTGAYTTRIELMAPAAVETRWSLELDVFQFNPDLAVLGFELPFRDYV